MDSNTKLTLGLFALGAVTGYVTYDAVHPVKHRETNSAVQVAPANAITLPGVFSDGGVRLTIADPKRGLQAPNDILCIEYLIERNRGISPVLAAKDGNFGKCAPLQLADSFYKKEALAPESQEAMFTRYQRLKQ